MKAEDVDAALVEKAARAVEADLLDPENRAVWETEIRTALAAVLPAIQAQALLDHAERRNQIKWTHSCFKPVCANCREVRLRQEERESLLRAAARLTATTEEPK